MSSSVRESATTAQSMVQPESTEKLSLVKRVWLREGDSTIMKIMKIALAIITIPTAWILDRLVGVYNWITATEQSEETPEKTEEATAEAKTQESTTEEKTKKASTTPSRYTRVVKYIKNTCIVKYLEDGKVFVGMGIAKGVPLAYSQIVQPAFSYLSSFIW